MALSHGVATTTRSAAAAPALSAPSSRRSESGQRATTSPATVAARSASRDPIVTRMPASASRTATPRPAGPVPPRIPTCTPLPSHNLAGAVGLLDGKRLLITGVLTDASLAFSVARLAQEEGAEIVLSGAGRALSLTRRTARKLPDRARGPRDRRHRRPSSCVRPGQRWRHVGSPRRPAARHRLRAARLPRQRHVRRRLGRRVDGVQHLDLLAQGPRRRLPPPPRGGGRRRRRSVVGLDFDATVAWPVYDWMGVAKAGLESLSRYLAKELGPRGIRVNLIAAGPVRTMAAKSIPGFSAFEDTWADRAPLGWDVHDSTAVAKACLALFSDLFPMTTGEILHVDGGVHAVGGSA